MEKNTITISFNFCSEDSAASMAEKLRATADIFSPPDQKENSAKEFLKEEKEFDDSLKEFEKKKTTKKEKKEPELFLPDKDEVAERIKDEAVETEVDLGDVEEDVKISQEEIIAAFQKFAKKKGRDKAGVILGKYKVKSVYDLEDKHYEKVMAELSA